MNDVKRMSFIQQIRRQIDWIPTSVSDHDVYKIYMLSVSMFQSRQSTNGNDLENIISKYLMDHGISFRRQIPINRDGCICTRNESISIIDFVIGTDVLIGKHIREFVVLSVKKSCRERWLQDEWTFTNEPKKYILFTLSNDYPDPVLRFRESKKRLIITLQSKKHDRRVYKLSPNDLLSELTQIS